MRWKCRALDDGSYQLMAVDENIDTFPKVCHDEMGKVHQNGQEWVGGTVHNCTVGQASTTFLTMRDTHISDREGHVQNEMHCL